MSDTKTLLDALGKPFPQEAIKTRVGGGNSRFSYVAGYTIIHRLNDATGGVWDWDIKTFDFRPLPPDKYGKEQSLVVVTGILTIPGLGSRAGIGVQKVSEGGGEDLVKGASTDALKKAATLFGVALELYGEDFEDEDRTPPQGLRVTQQSGHSPYREPPANRPAPPARTTPPAAQPVADQSIPFNKFPKQPPYAPQKAVAAEIALRATDDWTAVWTEAKAQGIQGRTNLAAFLGVAESELPAPAAILEKLRAAAAKRPASIAG